MHQDMYSHCRNHLHRYVLVHMQDGHSYDGIIADVDMNNLYLAVPISGMDTNRRGTQPPEHAAVRNPEATNTQIEQGESRQPWYPPYGGYPGYYPPFYPGYYPSPYYYRRPFSRLILPLAGLAALSLLPYW